MKQLKSAFENTVREMDIEFESMHAAMAEEIKKKYKSTVQSLTYKRKGENLLEHKPNEE